MKSASTLTGAFTTVMAAAIIAISSAPARSNNKDPSIEYAVKAAYLYKFAPFVQWPATSRTASFAVCIVGADPFGDILDKSVAQQKINERPITIQRHAEAQSALKCDVAYIARTARQGFSVLQGHPVLTVTDEAESDAPRGVIHFIVRDNRVRFEIDEAAAAQQGLIISSKLLDLAVPSSGGRQR